MVDEVEGDELAGSDALLPQRHIRSFVLREGRITEAQQRALDVHWQRYGLDFSGQEQDFDTVFGRVAPRVMEIGFGNGEALLWSAAHDPGRDYIGIEVHRPGVGRVLNALAAQDLRNVRVYRHDAVEVLAREVAPAVLTEVRIWFPDPWPKKRHHKRRLVQPAFVDLVAARVAAGGLLHLATDWQAYAEHMQAVLQAAPGWENVAADGVYVPRPAWRIETHFEQRGRKLGHGVWDLLYRRC